MFIFLLSIFFFLLVSTHASATDYVTGVSPNGSLLTSTHSWEFLSILSYIESVLLKLVLPLTVTGVTLYIAYQLFTAEGDEEKMKKAFKSITYSAVGIIAIACAYAFVAVLTRISL